MGNSWAYLFIRLGIGMSLFGHGLIRMPKLLAFSCSIMTKFKDSLLPSFLVQPFSYAIPVIEFATGLLLLLGLFTKISSITASILMLTLIFGTCMLEDWSSIPSQFIHLLFLSILLSQLKHNQFSVDNTIKNNV